MRSFNPHTHAGCDLVIMLVRLLLLSFNPHTHAGCDIGGWSNVININVSIHTPTQGVTLWDSKNTNVLKFQSTHPRRV